MSILVLCPTRGRPDKLLAAASSCAATRTKGGTRFMAIVDEDDPARDDYIKGNAAYHWLTVRHSGGMVAALNKAVGEILAVDDGPTILGFVGDDHRFRTRGWDERIEEALVEPGFAYANDGFWPNGEIPTQIFISRPIVAALGYYALPDCHHLFVDNAWRALAEELGVLHYLPDVLIEHMHPAGGKAAWDEGYKRVNSPEMYGRDGEAFAAWRSSPRFREDLERARMALTREAA